MKKVSQVMSSFKMQICDSCDFWIDEDEDFHFLDGEPWCVSCADSANDNDNG